MIPFEVAGSVTQLKHIMQVPPNTSAHGCALLGLTLNMITCDKDMKMHGKLTVVSVLLLLTILDVRMPVMARK